MTDSESLLQFVESINSCGQLWLDNFDMDSFDLLQGIEREQALEMILGQLVAGDARAARALAQIGDFRYIVQLKNALSASEDEMRVEIARALNQLGASDGMQTVILEVLRSLEPSDRVSAAYALAEFRSMESYIALLETIRSDRENEVRTAAAISLMLLSGIMSNPLDPACGDVLIRLAEGGTVEWEAVAEEFIGRLNVDCSRCGCCGAIGDRPLVVCSRCGTDLRGEHNK